MQWAPKAVVVVPIKTHNERLSQKNTRDLDGHPVYAYLFSTLRRLPEQVQVIIDTSDSEIGKIAVEWGFEHANRPVEFDDRAITGDELLTRLAPTLERSLVALLHVTTPFLSLASIKRGFETLEADSTVDSVFGMRPFYNRFWFRDAPVNHDPLHLLPTQDLEPVFEETNIYFVRREALVRYKKRVCGHYQTMPVSALEATDIDTLQDLATADGMLRHKVVAFDVLAPPFVS